MSSAEILPSMLRDNRIKQKKKKNKKKKHYLPFILNRMGIL